MRRRDFIAALGGAAVVMPHAARAQQTAARTIGWLSLRSADTSTEKSILAAFRQGLNQTGYVEGRNLTIELRFGDGHYDRLPALATDLVRRQVEVLVTGGGTNVARVAQPEDEGARHGDTSREGCATTRVQRKPALIRHPVPASKAPNARACSSSN